LMFCIDQENKGTTSIEYSIIKPQLSKFTRKQRKDRLIQSLEGTTHVFLPMELRVLVRHIQ